MTQREDEEEEEQWEPDPWRPERPLSGPMVCFASGRTFDRTTIDRLRRLGQVRVYYVHDQKEDA